MLLNQVTRVLGQDGDITITGTGGNNTGGSFGVYLDNFLNGSYGGTEVVSSGAGKITITGNGGNNSSGGNVGFVYNFNSLVQGAYGDITITGNGGSSTTGSNFGVSWNSSGSIVSTGTGPNAARINLIGNAGSGTSNNWGININADKVIAGLNSFASACSVACNGPTISSVDGDISIRGTGGAGTGGGNHGINIVNNYGAAGAAPVLIAGLGTASVSVSGTGGSGTGSGNSGLKLLSGSSTGALDIQATGPGSVTVSGSAGSGGSGISTGTASAIQTTGTGDVTLLADSLALGAANTVSSAAALTIRPLTTGTSVGIGNTAPGSLSLSDAELGELSWSGLLTIGGANAGATTIDTAFAFPGALAVVSGAGADITLAAPLSSTSGATGPTLTLSAGRNFINAAGVAALDPGLGAWRVYSSDPAADTRDGLVADFKQYAATYGVTPVQGSGNGLFYRIAPSLAAGLTGVAAKVYDGNAIATLTPANYTLTGVIDGDSVTIGNGSAIYDTRNAATGKIVTASGIAVTSASNGAIPVYGYSLISASTAAPIGTITPAPLTLNASADSKVYDGTAGSLATPGVAGLIAGDAVDVAEPSLR